RFPRRLMLGEDDAGPRGKIAEPCYAIANAADYPGQVGYKMRPGRNDPVTRNRFEGESAQRNDGEHNGYREPEEFVDDRTHQCRESAHATILRTASARSAKTGVPSGNPPAVSVSAPFPVSTSIGLAPAAAAA